MVQVLFETHEGSYLAGAAAALVSETGTVGFVGGLPLPPVEFARAAFAAGATAIDPDTEVVSIYLSADSESDAFFNPTRGRLAAEELIGRHADVIHHQALASGEGVLEAVRDASDLTGVQHWPLDRPSSARQCLRADCRCRSSPPRRHRFS